jgi:O-antigen ligase
VRQYVWRILPLIAVVHLVIWCIEAAGLLSDAPGTLLGLFRADDGVIERATGLMSEPSYVGAFAGLFGFTLFVRESPRLWRNRLIAVALVLVALSIRAKTVIPVCGLQLLGWLWFRRDRLSWPARLAIVVVFFGAAVSYVLAQAAFDLEENLSSVMRLGSTLLAANVATSGYGLTGVGFGQFHFFYRADFAPDFLMLSEEALNQLDPSSSGRASTYNLFLRILVEAGPIAFVLFLAMIVVGLARAARNGDDDSLFARLLTLGSLGFLLTQDTYFYPPLCLGLAMCYSFPRVRAVRSPASAKSRSAATDTIADPSSPRVGTDASS